ncbi:beta-lactamase family protein [Spongiibacter sp. KMU-166]|uniref:Beta-lactamase family protein n=1 Tax=Spongiibacter thalassae TaxID=2721624 RepID=A0ABX1GCF5_9GAMM|nr:beta-lactamase family protein [Spongiibacter thalassae]
MLKFGQKIINRGLMRAPDLRFAGAASLRVGEGEVAPPSGLDRSDVEEIWAKAAGMHDSGMHPMVSMCMRYKGDIVLHRSIGQARGTEGAGPVMAELDTPVCLFSASKVVIAVLVHKMAEDGLIDLLNPVSYYIPAFAQNGKANLSVYQLLSHRAGVPGVPEGTPTATVFDHDATVQLICRQASLDNDGRIVAYHALTGGAIMAELIRVCTGLGVNEYLDQVIRQPMGMRYFRYGLAAEDQPQVAQNFTTGLPNYSLLGRHLRKVLGSDVENVVRVSNSPQFLDAEIPSANLYATAEEAGRFFQMLLQQGQWQGKQILSPLTVFHLAQEATPPQLDKSLMLPMRYSAGTMLGGRRVGLYGLNTPYAFGHLGFSNILCWADPQRDLSVAVLNNGKPVIGSHLKSLLGLLYTLGKACPQRRDMTFWNENMGHFSQRKMKEAAMQAIK